eukprot:scaffold270828_cov32-Tisochrysis_lutea.AAC.3
MVVPCAEECVRCRQPRDEGNRRRVSHRVRASPSMASEGAPQESPKSCAKKRHVTFRPAYSTEAIYDLELAGWEGSERPPCFKQ